jgi:hypothetical protein
MSGGAGNLCVGGRNTGVVVQSNANCDPATATDGYAVASHPVASPSNAVCQFGFMYYLNAGACSAATTQTCTVDMADGLPVELLDFEVDDD